MVNENLNSESSPPVGTHKPERTLNCAKGIHSRCAVDWCTCACHNPEPVVAVEGNNEMAEVVQVPQNLPLAVTPPSPALRAAYEVDIQEIREGVREASPESRQQRIGVAVAPQDCTFELPQRVCGEGVDAAIHTNVLRGWHHSYVPPALVPQSVEHARAVIVENFRSVAADGQVWDYMLQDDLNDFEQAIAATAVEGLQARIDELETSELAMARMVNYERARADMAEAALASPPPSSAPTAEEGN